MDTPPTPTIAPVFNPQTGWNIYKTKDYSIEIPKDWKKTQDTNENLTFAAPNSQFTSWGAFKSGNRIVIEKHTAYPPDILNVVLNYESTATVLSKQRTSVDGHPATRAVVSGDYENNALEVISGGNLYIFLARYDATTKADTLKIFDTMVNRIRFTTKPVPTSTEKLGWNSYRTADAEFAYPFEYISFHGSGDFVGGTAGSFHYTETEGINKRYPNVPATSENEINGNSWKIVPIGKEQICDGGMCGTNSGEYFTYRNGKLYQFTYSYPSMQSVVEEVLATFKFIQ